ncbi:hypothetical protein GQ54DRAFT_75027 [Martensiomyces pterosporus]|nr:hypothetical protein GQ54DRAFT_75027 [Martensiomyces pterosporus]
MSQQIAARHSRALLCHTRLSQHAAGNSRRRRRLYATRSSSSSSSRHHSVHQIQPQNASRDMRASIAEASERVARLVSGEWTTQSEIQAAEALEACHRVLSSNPQITADETLRICQLADQLGQRMVGKELKSFPLGPFTRYLEVYACLGRPDVTQQAFERVKLQWRQPSMAVYAAQQLALLRFKGDRATGGSTLLRTLPRTDGDADRAAEVVESRLVQRTVREVVEDALRRERRTKRLVKVLEYGSYTALAALIAKWAWIGNSVLLSGVGLLPKALASIAALLASAAGVRLALRHSVMGSLTAPSLSSPPQAVSGGLKDVKLPRESDDGARRILRRAFPASPSDEAMMEVNEILMSSHALRRPKPSWRLQMALAWSKFARRFAVVEPVMISDRGLLQRLAVLWMRNITHMFPDSESRSPSKETSAASSSALLEFVGFVRASFAAIPLALTHREIVAISGFAAKYADARALDEFLVLAAGGSMVLVRGSAAEEAAVGDDQPMNQAAEVSIRADGLVTMAESDIRRHSAGAAILALETCIHQLAQSADYARLSVALEMLLKSTDVPASASLYRTAFAAAAAAARAPGSIEMSAKLADSLAERYRERDPRVVRATQLSKGPLSVGWRLGSKANARPAPIVGCVAPYISLLAQQAVQQAGGGRAGDPVSKFVEGWAELGILGSTSAILCLSSAVQSLPAASASHSQASACVEAWVKVGCNALDPSDMESAKALYRLLSHALKFSDMAGATDCGLRVYLLGNEAVLRHRHLQELAPSEFNALAIKIFTAAALEHVPSEQSRKCVHLALDVLDQMRVLGQAPSWPIFDKLSTAASRLGIDFAKETEFWSRTIKERAKTNKMSSFAKSLL